MPIGDPTGEVPESDMRLLRPIGLGLLALIIGFNGTYLLIWMVQLAGGPDLMDWLLPVSLSASVLALAWVVRRSRRKRAEAARRKAAGEPRPLGRVLVASVLLTILGLVGVWGSLRARPVEVSGLGACALLLIWSIRSLVTSIMELRARKAA